MPILRALGVLLVFAAAGLGHELRLLGGKSIKGTVTAITEKDITIQTEAGAVVTPMSQVLALDLQAVKGMPAEKYTDVRLLDDTVLHCSGVSFKGKDIELALPSGTKLKLPLSYVISVVKDGQDKELQKKWITLASAKVKHDRIVFLKNGELNDLEGTLGDVDTEGKTIQFKLLETGDVRSISLDRPHGLIFYRLEGPAGTPLCRVLDSQGNSLTALKVAFDGKNFILDTTFGAKLTLDKENLARFDFNMGKLTFLSDLEPAKVVERSGAGLVTPYRRDANLAGEAIVLGGATHAKGLSLHAHTELEYNLAGKYKDFKAILGVDPRVGSDSQALVTIICDGDKRFSEVVTLKALRPISLSVKDVTTLKIVVSSRNFLDLHDHVTLAEARVSQ
jgi:hypothetical protein